MLNTSKFLLALFIVLFSCKSSEMVNNAEEKSSCPKNGKCTSELIPNKSLNFIEDSIGALYLKAVESENIIFKYRFVRNQIENTVDGHYSEEIYFEFNPNVSELILENTELKQAKLQLNRICYCKGTAGFFPITEGKLVIKKMTENSFQIQLTFKQNDVPHIITSINETVILK